MEHSVEFIERMKECTSCDLHINRIQVVVGDYGPRRGIVFIGEAPGANEDKQGRPFVGRSGKLLDKMLQHIGYERSDVSVLNIAKCRPPNNREPTNEERKVCSSLWLQTQLTYLAPRIIIPLGRVALTHFVPKARITASKAKLLQSDDGFVIFPLFHPSYILRGGGKAEEGYREDFELLKTKLDALSEDSQKPEIQDSRAVSETKDTTSSSLDDFF